MKPRQYALVLLILLIGGWNLYRHARRSAAQATGGPAAVAATSTAPRGQSPAWASFDTLAAARDADAATWAPALAAFNTALTAAATSPEAGDLEGCKTWLLFYRNEHLHPSGRAGFAQQTTEHVDACVRDHHDSAH